MTDHEGHAAALVEQIKLLREALAETAAPALGGGEEAVLLTTLPCGAEPDLPGLEINP